MHERAGPVRRPPRPRDTALPRQLLVLATGRDRTGRADGLERRLRPLLHRPRGRLGAPAGVGRLLQRPPGRQQPGHARRHRDSPCRRQDDPADRRRRPGYLRVVPLPRRRHRRARRGRSWSAAHRRRRQDRDPILGLPDRRGDRSRRGRRFAPRSRRREPGTRPRVAPGTMLPGQDRHHLPPFGRRRGAPRATDRRPGSRLPRLGRTRCRDLCDRR